MCDWRAAIPTAPVPGEITTAPARPSTQLWERPSELAARMHLASGFPSIFHVFLGDSEAPKWFRAARWPRAPRAIVTETPGPFCSRRRSMMT